MIYLVVLPLFVRRISEEWTNNDAVAEYGQSVIFYFAIIVL